MAPGNSIRPPMLRFESGCMSSFLESLKMAAVDTETSGVNPWKHELIEIGAVRFTIEGIENRFEALVKPEKKHDPKARAVHQISSEELETKGIGLKAALSDFLDFIAERPLVFHNASFDITFLKVSTEKVKLTLPNNYYYDNLYISKKYFPDRESHSLSSLREELSLKTGKEHRALADAEATALAFIYTLKQNYNDLQSRKSFNKFMRYNRRLHKFTIRLPKNFEDIQKYFQRRIRGNEFIKVNYRDQKGNNYLHIVQPIDLMIFNQNLYLKAKIQWTAEERLIPLKDAVFFDPEVGQMKFQ